ncbi:unnamed protein product [Chironomus riparius]|uniref:Uncharacterized protein n=1 Tax=Chironomus riparius TaxID=315576 RepID=A0A9P0NNJ8_9DIPT|nr:unnamed protein product [Chironomus riparius]
MGKCFYLLFLLCLFSIIKYSKSVNIKCNFIWSTYSSVDTVYTCKVTNDLRITQPDDAVIEDVSGTHLSGYDNDNVNAFHVDNKTMGYFPKDLDKFFKNLKAIYIINNKINQISHTHLKPLQNLVFLSLFRNQIEILEDGLFDNNPDMQVLWYESNKIIHVGKSVFNNMNNLTYLVFDSNLCINAGAHNSHTDVQILVESLKTKCIDANFDEFSQSLSNVETESKNLTFETFSIWRRNLENLENEFNNSKFSYLISIKKRFEVLNDIKIGDFTTQNPFTSSTTEVAVTKTSAQPDDCMYDNFNDLENNLSETFKISLNQTEHNLKNSFAESCTDVNYQTLYLMKDEFTKINEKLFEHSSEVRSELIKNDVQHSSILSDISNLKGKIENLEEKIDKILNAVYSGN